MTSSEPPLVIFVEFDVAPHAVEAFTEALRIGVGQRTTFPGALRIDAYRSAEDPTLFTLIESFRCQADVDAYYASELHSAWMASIRPLIRDIRSADQRLIYAYQAS